MNMLRKYSAPVLFCILGIIFAVILAALLIQDKKAKALEKRASELQRSAISAMRLSPAADDLRKMMAKAESALPSGYDKMNPETEIFRSLDRIKGIFKNSEMKVSDFDYTNNMVAMTVSIKVYITNYPVFADSMFRLQSSEFPFFSILGVNMLSSKDDGAVTADISGRLWFPSKVSSPEGGAK
ncbi:MAG: hypothetical protein JXR79_07285 [Nitrospirae bacterium]|nr:hypothetical protein [Nitrospirota bacterium]